MCRTIFASTVNGAITVTNTGTISLDVDPNVGTPGALSTRIATLDPKTPGVLDKENTTYSFKSGTKEVATVFVDTDNDNLTVSGGSRVNNAKLTVTVELGV